MPGEAGAGARDGAAPATPPAAMLADPQVAPATPPAAPAGDDALRDLRESCGLRQAFTSANGAPVWRSRTPAVDAPGIDALLDLGVRRVWDLRAESERAVAPAVRIPGARVSVPDEPLYVVMRAGVGTRATRPATGPHDVPSLPGLADATLARQLREGDLGRQRPGERMANIYASMAEHVEALVPAVHALAFATEPTLVFCSSGKDRTGVACYCAQRVLGATHEEGLADYLATNAVNAQVNGADIVRLAERGVPAWRLEVALSLFLAKEEYLGVFVREVARRYGAGGFDAFLDACRTYVSPEERRSARREAIERDGVAERVTFTAEKRFDVDDLVRLYATAGRSDDARRPERLARALAASPLVVSAWDGGRLVGLARAIDDGGMLACVRDVLVDPAYRAHGIASRIMRLVMDHYRDYPRVEVVAEHPRDLAFYERFGFHALDDVRDGGAAGGTAGGRDGGAAGALGTLMREVNLVERA